MLKLIDELEPKGAFDPETLRILTAAFDAVWASIEASGASFSEAKDAERAREIIGKHIIQAAKNGERDQQKLCDGALLQLARSDLKLPHKQAPPPHQGMYAAAASAVGLCPEPIGK
jgi:hypothetical protein